MPVQLALDRGRSRSLGLLGPCPGLGLGLLNRNPLRGRRFVDASATPYPTRTGLRPSGFGAS